MTRLEGVRDNCPKFDLPAKKWVYIALCIVYELGGEKLRESQLSLISEPS